MIRRATVYPRESKYANKKVTFCGETFDSQAERDYYLYLLSLQQQKEIVRFHRQPRYMLQESFKKAGKTIRAIEYISDFEIEYPDGRIEVVDVKPSASFKTDVYKLKRKLFEKRYPSLTIHEVYKNEIRKMR